MAASQSEAATPPKTRRLNLSENLRRQGSPRPNLLQQIRLFADNSRPQRLELEPSRDVRSNLLARDRCVSRVNLYWRANRLSHQLSLATSFHGDKPPGRFIYRLTYSQQAVVAQYHCFPVAQGSCNSLAFRCLVHHPGKVRE